MDKTEEQLEALSQIRFLMERSSRFISLSGLSGVFAGLFALAGAAAAYNYLGYNMNLESYYERVLTPVQRMDFYTFFILDAGIVLLLSLATGIILTTRKAKQKGLSVWDPVAKRMIISIGIPLVAGGLFCLILLRYELVGLVAPSMLLFYGLALINGSKYTLNDIFYLGLCETALGLIAALNPGHGLFFWAVGFGLLHIIYGSVMYFKYER